MILRTIATFALVAALSGCGEEEHHESATPSASHGPSGGGDPSLADWVPEAQGGAAQPGAVQPGAVQPGARMPDDAVHGGAGGGGQAPPVAPGTPMPNDSVHAGLHIQGDPVAPPADGPTAPAPAPPADGAGAAPPSRGAAVVEGPIRETMDSGGYTYMRVDGDSGTMWVAASQREVAVGSRARATGMVMQGFHSNTLDRTFDQLMLASDVTVTPAP